MAVELGDTLLDSPGLPCPSRVTEVAASRSCPLHLAESSPKADVVAHPLQCANGLK